MKYLLFLFPYVISSQSLFNQELSIGLGFSSINQFTSASATLGYSLDGRTDLYSTVLRGSSIGLVETNLTLGSSYYLLQQDDEVPISFSIGGSYSYAKLSGDALQGLNATGRFGTFTTALYHEITLDKLRLFPGAFMSYIVGRYKYTAGSILVAEQEANGISGGIEVTLLTDHIAITPFVFFANKRTGIGLQLAYLL